MKISVILPVLNEADSIEQTLLPLQNWRERGHQLILVDAQSRDNTLQLARPLVDDVLQSTKGRANQMNAGVELARHEILLFLHADTVLAENDDQIIINALKSSQWGRFNVRFSSKQLIFKVIALMMNIRSCLTGIATGDQAIFIKKELFSRTGGYPVQPLMEDIELSKRLKRLSRIVCIKQTVETSSRRWQKNGVLRTIILMWCLRAAYFLGVSAGRLKHWYH